MLVVHAVGQKMSYPTDKAVLKGGTSYEMYVYRPPRFTAVIICAVLAACSLAFLLYALFSKIDDLWIYATVALAVTGMLVLIFLFVAFFFNYESISLAGTFANAYASQHSLLVIRRKGAPTEAWFASGFVLFMQKGETHMYASADLHKVNPAALQRPAAELSKKVATVLRRRSFVQTDTTDLRDYLRCVAEKNKFLLANKAGLVH